MKTKINYFTKTLLIIFLSYFISACGGGGGNNEPINSPTNNQTGNVGECNGSLRMVSMNKSYSKKSTKTTAIVQNRSSDLIVESETVDIATLEWQPNVYPVSSSLKNYCESPRISTTTQAFADQQGSNFLEKMWLRSWSEDIYLWYRELVDFDVDLIESPQDYFDTRKTNAITSTGTARDQFHFYRDTESYNQQVSSGSSIGYGVNVAILSSIPPRRIVVTSVEPNSPADIANIERGDEIITVDGADLIYGNDINTLNAGLIPGSANEVHQFQLKSVGTGSLKSVNLRSASIEAEPVHNTTVLTECSTGDKIGYLTFNTFGTYTAEAALENAFQFLSNNNVTDLVLDLRYNGGGFLAISSQLAYMIAGSNSVGQTYYQTEYNDKYINSDPSGNAILPYPFYNRGLGLTTPAGKVLPTLNLNRVYVLTSNDTCSASEAVINGLQGIGVEVIQIGGKTCGKPYGFVGTDNCGTTYFTVTFQGVNSQGFGDYPDGFYPSNSVNANGSVSVKGCEVADDYSTALGNPNEGMLSAALEYRSSGTCPALPTVSSSQRSLSKTRNSENDLMNDSRIRNLLMQETSLLLH